MISQYRLVRQLGSGGYGEIWLGERIADRSPVVVKFLRECMFEKIRRGFLREVNILRRRIHSGFIDVLFADLDAPVPYYVMPYAEGGSLTRWAGKLSLVDQLNVATSLADALSALHRKSIAHGDIKPDNVLVMAGRVKCSDPLGNGTGCTISLSTKCGGTPGYMAPEVALRQAVISPRGDAYSFGALLFHLVTGVHPIAFAEREVFQLDVAAAGGGADHPLRQLIWELTVPDPRRRTTIESAYVRLRSLPEASRAPEQPAAPATATNPLAWVAVVLLAAAGLGAVAYAARK